MRLITGILLTVVLLTGGVAMADKSVKPGKYSGVDARRTQQPPRTPVRYALDELFLSTDVPKTIPDGPGGVATSTLTTANPLAITDLNVYVRIEHTWMRDLQLTLIGPGDTTNVLLLDLLPIDNAVNMDGWFDDESGTGILEADTPLVGVWAPIGELSIFDGRSAAGTWTLRILDRFRLDSGRVTAWGIDVNPVPSLTGTVSNSLDGIPINGARVELLENGRFTVSDAGGRYEFIGLGSDTFTVAAAAAFFDADTLENVITVDGQTTTLNIALSSQFTLRDYISRADTVAIPDGDSASMSLTIRDSLTIVDLDVTVNLTHTFVGDLSLFLRSPAGTQVRLISSNNAVSGENFINCRFDDDAAQSITQGTAPFTGRFRPVQPLTAFDNTNSAGQWTLYVRDSLLVDSGTINNFTIHIAANPLSISPRTGAAVAAEFTFYGSYPNPFNAQTQFRFDLIRPGRVQLIVYDLLGREAARVADGVFPAGPHAVSFRAAGLASGVYIARLSVAGSGAQQKKILLIK